VPSLHSSSQVSTSQRSDHGFRRSPRESEAERLQRRERWQQVRTTTVELPARLAPPAIQTLTIFVSFQESSTRFSADNLRAPDPPSIESLEKVLSGHEAENGAQVEERRPQALEVTNSMAAGRSDSVSVLSDSVVSASVFETEEEEDSRASYGAGQGIESIEESLRSALSARVPSGSLSEDEVPITLAEFTELLQVKDLLPKHLSLESAEHIFNEASVESSCWKSDCRAKNLAPTDSSESPPPRLKTCTDELPGPNVPVCQRRRRSRRGRLQGSSRGDPCETKRGRGHRGRRPIRGLGLVGVTFALRSRLRRARPRWHGLRFSLQAHAR